MGAIKLADVEKRGDVWVLREDAVRHGGARGTKARTVHAMTEGARGVVTSGGREGTQGVVVAAICKTRGVPCVFHCPNGPETDTLRQLAALGATVVRWKNPRRNVISCRAREDATARGYCYVPAWMECAEMVSHVIRACDGMSDWPCRRLVVPVGGGMTLCGVLHARNRHGSRLPVLGVYVGNDPTKQLKRFGPANYAVRLELIAAAGDYAERGVDDFRGVPVDPIYSGKCVPFLTAGDMLWNSGARQTIL